MDKIKFMLGEEYYSATVIRTSQHVVSVIFNDVIPDKSVYESGFNVVNERNHKVMAKYTEYTTTYRIIGTEIQLSDDGSTWIDPTPQPIDITVKINWADDDDIDEIRPASVKVVLNADGEKFETKTITAKMNWTHTWSQLPYDKEYTITVDDVDSYTYEINEYNITFTHRAVATLRKNKIKEIIEASDSDIDAGIVYDDVRYPYDGSLKDILEVARQTGHSIVYKNNLLSSEDFATIFVDMEEKRVRNNKYVLLMADMINELTDYDEIDALSFGSDLDPLRSEELYIYTTEQNRIIESYAAQLNYATVDELVFVEDALTEIYEIIGMLEV